MVIKCFVPELRSRKCFCVSEFLCCLYVCYGHYERFAYRYECLFHIFTYGYVTDTPRGKWPNEVYLATVSSLSSTHFSYLCYRACIAFVKAINSKYHVIWTFLPNLIYIYIYINVFYVFVSGCLCVIAAPWMGAFICEYMRLIPSHETRSRLVKVLVI